MTRRSATVVSLLMLVLVQASTHEAMSDGCCSVGQDVIFVSARCGESTRHLGAIPVASVADPRWPASWDEGTFVPGSATYPECRLALECLVAAEGPGADPMLCERSIRTLVSTLSDAWAESIRAVELLEFDPPGAGICETYGFEDSDRRTGWCFYEARASLALHEAR